MKSVDGFFIWICMYRAQYWEISEVEKSKELDHFVLGSRVRKTGTVTFLHFASLNMNRITRSLNYDFLKVIKLRI